MNILVTGANGFVGKNLINELVKNPNLKIIQALRNEDRQSNQNTHCIYIGDLAEKSDYYEKLRGIDVIIHTAARVHIMNDKAADPLTEFRKINTDATLHLANEAIKAGVKRFIFISSIKVNGNQSDINAPINADSAPYPHDPYSISKYEAEIALKKISESSNLEIIIIRPTLIYGPGVKANFSALIKLINKGLPLPLGRVNNKRSYLYIGNLVDLIIKCLDHPHAPNNIFIASDDTPISTSELAMKINSALKNPSIIFSSPIYPIKLILFFLGKRNISDRLFGNLHVDISKTKNTLNWSPPYTVDKAINLTIHSFDEND